MKVKLAGYVWSSDGWRDGALLLKAGARRRRVIVFHDCEGFPAGGLVFQPGLWIEVEGVPYGRGLIYAKRIRAESRPLRREDVLKFPTKALLRRLGLTSFFSKKKFGSLAEYILAKQNWRDAARPNGLAPEQAFVIERLVCQALDISSRPIYPPPAVWGKLADTEDGEGVKLEEFRQRIHRLCNAPGREFVARFWDFLFSRAPVTVENGMVRPTWRVRVEKDLTGLLKSVMPEGKESDLLNLSEMTPEKLLSALDADPTLFRRFPWVSVVVGPGGSGKTSLLKSLRDIFEKHCALPVCMLSARGEAALRAGGFTVHYATEAFRDTYFPRNTAYELILVDEAQFLRPNDLFKLLRRSRGQFFVFAGDPAQAHSKYNALEFLLKYLPSQAVLRLHSVRRYNLRERLNLAVVIKNAREAALVAQAWAAKIILEHGPKYFFQNAFLLTPHVGRFDDSIDMGKLGVISLSRHVSELFSGSADFEVMIAKKNIYFVFNKEGKMIPNGAIILYSRKLSSVLVFTAAGVEFIGKQQERFPGDFDDLLKILRHGTWPGPARTIESAVGLERAHVLTIIPYEPEEEQEMQKLLEIAHGRATKSSVFVVFGGCKKTISWLEASGYQVRRADLGKAKSTLEAFREHFSGGELLFQEFAPKSNWRRADAY